MTTKTIGIAGEPIGGTLLDSNPFVIGMGGMNIPSTVTLTSAAAGRLIEVSTDGGTNYFTPTYDASTAGMINVGLFAPVSHVRVTGAAADTWSVR